MDKELRDSKLGVCITVPPGLLAGASAAMDAYRAASDTKPFGTVTFVDGVPVALDIPRNPDGTQAGGIVYPRQQADTRETEMNNAASVTFEFSSKVPYVRRLTAAAGDGTIIGHRMQYSHNGSMWYDTEAEAVAAREAGQADTPIILNDAEADE